MALQGIQEAWPLAKRWFLLSHQRFKPESVLPLQPQTPPAVSPQEGGGRARLLGGWTPAQRVATPRASISPVHGTASVRTWRCPSFTIWLFLPSQLQTPAVTRHAADSTIWRDPTWIEIDRPVDNPSSFCKTSQNSGNGCTRGIMAASISDSVSIFPSRTTVLWN